MMPAHDSTVLAPRAAPHISRWTTVATEAAVALAATAWFAWFGRHSIDVLHDGVMFKAAADVAEGATLFRDTFTIYGPLTVYIQASAILLFGKKLIVLRHATALFYGLTAPLLLRLWRPFLGATVAVLAVLVWALTAPMLVWTLVPWASVYALFFQALSGTLLLGAVGRGSDRGLVLAGFVASLTFLCRQPVGIVTSIALGFFLVVHGHGTRRGLAPLLRFIGGHVIGVVPAFGFLAAEGALTDWWIQNIKTPLTWSSLEDAGGPPPSVLHKLLPALGHEMFPAAFATLTWTLLPLITLATLAVSGWIVWRTRATSAPAADASRTPTTALFLVSCLGIASWAQYVPITCIRHVYWSATFMIGVAFGASAMLASAVVARAGRPDVVRWRRLAVGLATVACLGGLFGRDIAMRIATARTRFATPYFDAGGHDIFTGMLLSPSEAFLVSKVRALAAAYPESQFIGTRHFGALFLTLRPQGFKFLPYEGAMYYPTFVADLTRYAETHDVIFVTSERTPPPPIDADRTVVLRESPYLFIRFTPKPGKGSS